MFLIYQVTSPYGNTLYHQENVTHGQFALTTSEIGNYVAAFGLMVIINLRRSILIGKLGLLPKTGIQLRKKSILS